MNTAGRRLLALCVGLLAIAVVGLGVAAARRSNASPHADPAERRFIASVGSNLMSRYPTRAQALRSDYIAITGIESDGTAVYFDPSRTRIDALHPNFLWYDRRGKLVGLDYELPVSSYPHPPAALFPVSRARWTTVKEHIHFNYRIGDGPMHMGISHPRANIRANPVTAAQLRADKLLPANAKLLWVYDHPKSWDLGFWLVRNPNGAFASRDPLVHK